MGLTPQSSECRGGINALASPICDLRLLRGSWSERSWICLRRTVCISGAAEGAGVGLASVYHSQTCAQVGSKVGYSLHLPYFSGDFPGTNEQYRGQLREQQRPLTLWNANHLLCIKGVSSWK